MLRDAHPPAGLVRVPPQIGEIGSTGVGNTSLAWNIVPERQARELLAAGDAIGGVIEHDGAGGQPGRAEVEGAGSRSPADHLVRIEGRSRPARPGGMGEVAGKLALVGRESAARDHVLLVVAVLVIGVPLHERVGAVVGDGDAPAGFVGVPPAVRVVGQSGSNC